MNKPVRHDWRKVISGWKTLYYRIHRRELTSYKLGLMVGLHRDVITRLETKARAQPPHYEGDLILYEFAEISAKYAQQVVASGEKKVESAALSGPEVVSLSV